MKLTLEPTGQLELVQGTPCRVWSGTTDTGLQVLAWVATVQPQTHDLGKLMAFEEELIEMPYRREAAGIVGPSENTLL
ncbi:hypothetical protein [Methylobacterium iners]|uniref:Uncharacterized protein n=1 Tax=Methylobacterium iners TaxID=418707 RepID=A0ABQ4RQ37_9HYPH|nr:hypothetical protein [Methylobacterium iners]GJD92873.1 hypothetical protein OCOJLMKI_0056 [Methylobacterium iners]